jgi:DNA-binding CsgD family transcriptional regulator
MTADELFPEQGSQLGLRGRVNECALLDDLVSAVRRGESRSLLLVGEAGIGKTALVRHLIATATTSGLTVLRTVGVESDMELAYASLHQLCAPLLESLDVLPAPQRQALEVVFGRSAGQAPDRFLVGLAILSLFAAISEREPLLCIIDDSQWLDQTSAQTLAFVSRRLLAEPIGMVFAARDPGLALRDVPELKVNGVPNGDARALLDSALRVKLDERVRDQIIAEVRGNPLALLELPRGLTAAQLAGGFGLLDTQALKGKLEEHYVSRLKTLTDDARLLLMLAAADPVGDPALLWNAAGRLRLRPEAAEAAAADGMLAIGVRVTFRHPLVRSAVYQMGSVRDRRAVHLALAQATDQETDPDRRAWHLAAATHGPDEHVALELERSAGQAQARGGFAAAAAFLARAVALTEDPARRAERAIAGAQASLQTGAFDMALGLLATAEGRQLDDFERARADLLRGQVAFMSFRSNDAPALLLKAARRLEPFDLDLARDTYLTAWGTAVVAADREIDAVLLEICAAVQALPPRPEGPRPLDLLLDGLALLIIKGHADATPTLRRAATALADLPANDVLLLGWIAPTASGLLWDVEGMRSKTAQQVRLLRDAGALAALTSSLSHLAMATAWTGDFAGAASLIHECDDVSVTIGSRQAPSAYALRRLRALQGRKAGTTTVEVAAGTAAEEGTAATWAQWNAANAAILYNGLARYDDAVSAAQLATSNPIQWWSMWALPELVEAAVRGGDTDLAGDALERLAATTHHCGTDCPLGIEARCRALVSVGATADGLYREAIERMGRTPLRPELARAHLLYGEWLRRADRRVEARGQLRSAYSMFVTMGMEAFAERARTELLATGEKVRKRSVDTREVLTAHERQIAQLASDGMSNPEIGTRLYLSSRTIEWHLGNVFTKLGIRSRRELAAALAESGSPVLSI